jgi:DHHC palmitoyltransferase
MNDDDSHQTFPLEAQPKLRRIEQQKRAFMSRDQVKSDQPCLMVPEIVIEDNNEESERQEKAIGRSQPHIVD